MRRSRRFAMDCLLSSVSWEIAKKKQSRMRKVSDPALTAVRQVADAEGGGPDGPWVTCPGFALFSIRNAHASMSTG